MTEVVAPAARKEKEKGADEESATARGVGVTTGRRRAPTRSLERTSASELTDEARGDSERIKDGRLRWTYGIQGEGEEEMSSTLWGRAEEERLDALSVEQSCKKPSIARHMNWQM
jgi:hypothetical protein